jgi:hypothetical protein
LATLLEFVPELTGTVLDLPTVVAGAVEHPRLTAMAGNAFDSVPAGFDTYLLVNVLHDWGDDDATRILGTVARAAAGRGRVVVVEADAAVRPIAGIGVASDVLMAALTPGGRERTTKEIRALGERAGLQLASRTPLASVDVAWTFTSATPHEGRMRPHPSP